MKKDKTITQEIVTRSVSEEEVKEYLSNAFRNQNINLIKLIINNYLELANKPTHKGILGWCDYPLELAISIEDINDRHEVINLLVVKGADVNQIFGTFSFKNSLEAAFIYKKMETFELLRKLGADLGKTNVLKRIDNTLDYLELEKDDQAILANFQKLYDREFKIFDSDEIIFDNYANLQKILIWYHSLSIKYKDNVYKDKIISFLAKAKQDAIEYLLVLQDQLMNYFEDEENPESMLMLKNKKFDQAKEELTDAEIKLLQNSVIKFLNTEHNNLQHIALLMNYQNYETLKDVIGAAKNYLLTKNVQDAIDSTLSNYKGYSKEPLMSCIKKAEEINRELEKKLQLAAMKIDEQKTEIKILCDHANVKINDGEIVVAYNPNDENVVITGYSWKFVEQL